MKVSLPYISWRNIIDKRLSSLLSILLLAVSIGLIAFLFNFNRQLNSHFLKNIQGVDLIVGASGSPLQTMLSSVYFIDAPTGNIDHAIFEKLQKHPLVNKAIPLAFGDNYKGFSIVGTNKEYIASNSLEISDGDIMDKPFDVVIGQKVAMDLKLAIGDQFHSAHGRHEEGDVHDNHSFTVSGVMSESNSVADNLILCNYQDVWLIHDHGKDSLQDEKKELTSILIDLRNPMGMIVLSNLMRNENDVQVVVPSVEIDRLFKLFGFGREALDGLAYLIFILAGLSIFISLYNAMQNRKYEVALMRSMGATKGKVFTVVMIEVLLLGIIGIIAGLIVSRIGLFLMSTVMESNYQYTLDITNFYLSEMLVIPLTIALCILAGLIPSIKAMNIDVAQVLTDEF